MKGIWICVTAASVLTSCVGIAQQSCPSRVFVTVLDSHNQAVDGLSAGDFRAKSRGADLSLSIAASAPAVRRFVFVLDRSGSMRTAAAPPDEFLPPSANPASLVPEVVADAIGAIPVGSSVAFLAFAGHHALQSEFLEPSVALSKAPEILAWIPAQDRHRTSTRTPLWDNIDAALRMLRPHKPGDVIVVISDGGDNLSSLSDKRVRNEILNGGVQVLAFVVSSRYKASQEEGGQATLLDLAKASGGFSTMHGYARGAPDSDVTLSIPPRQVISLLARQYELIVDAPPMQNPEKWTLRVTSPERRGNVRVFYPRYLTGCAVTP